jgi:hypothetical protein
LNIGSFRAPCAPKYDLYGPDADGTVVDGVLAMDTLSVSGLILPNFQFTEVTSYETPQKKGANDQDGIAGMSFMPDAAQVGFTPNVPLMVALIQKKVVSIGQFSYYIAPGEKTGAATFGGYQAKYFANTSESLVW